VLLVTVMVSAGCTHTVAGNVVGAPDLTRRPLSAEAIQQVPLDGTELLKILGQNLMQHDAPAAGGVDQLFDAKAVVSPADCVGLAEVLQKKVYQDAQVKGFAAQTWLTNGEPGKVMLVEQGVVALPTAGQADALFGKFATQWQGCAGGTVTEVSGPVITTDSVGDVQVGDDLIATTITQNVNAPNMPPLLPNKLSRALGLALNCIIETQVVFFTGRHASDPGTADPDTSGAELVQAMGRKIDDLG
jgi:hypothetical protein